MTGKDDLLDGGRPSTEPLYSKGNRDDYPLTEGYDLVKYANLIKSHVTNSDKMLISQTICEEIFSGIFGWHKIYKSKAASWCKKSSYDDLVEHVKRKWKDGRNIFSLEVDDETGSYYVYMVNGYGNGQTIVKQLSKIRDKWDDGRKITSCTSKGSTYYIVMTGKVDRFHSKSQTYFTRSSWSDVESKINKHYEYGKIITSICYNQGLEEYLVVMTKSSDGQRYKWTTSSSKRSKWMDEMYEDEDYHPTIVFKDPNDDNILVVMTSDEHRSGYTACWDVLLK